MPLLTKSSTPSPAPSSPAPAPSSPAQSLGSAHPMAQGVEGNPTISDTAPSAPRSTSIDDFLRDVPNLPDAAPTDTTTPEEPAAETPDETAETTPSETPETTDEGQSEETQPTTETSQQPQVQKPPTRPYEKFPPEMRQDLRKMSSPAFSHFEKVWDDNQRLQGELKQKEAAVVEASNSRWFTHESAWLLNPDVTQTAAGIRDTSEQLEFTKQQMLAVESGQPWVNRWKNEKGEYEEQQLQPSPEAKLHLNSLYMDLRADLQQKRGDYQNLKQNFQKSVSSYKNILGNLNGTYFPSSDTPEWKSAIDRVLSGAPQYLAQMPEMQLLAKALITIDYLRTRDVKGSVAQSKTQALSNAAVQSGKVKVPTQSPASRPTSPQVNKRGIPVALEEETEIFRKYGVR